MVTANAPKDRFTIWPSVLACGFPAILIILWCLPFDLIFIGGPLLFGAWALSALVVLGMAIFSAKERNWRQAVSFLILPVVTTVVVSNFSAVSSLAMEGGERIHFQLMRSKYVEDIAKLQSSGDPRFALWDWGGFVIGHGVIYDESDEIMLAEKSPAWKKRVANTSPEVVACGAWGTALGNHFYLVRIGC